jgi:nucleoside-diphosphate-sugar epimerase
MKRRQKMKQDGDNEMGNKYGMRNQRVFITGGAGFIATRIAAEIADDNEIILYDNLHNNAYQHTGLSRHKNVRLIIGDILDVDKLSNSLPDDVNYVIHCAAIAGVDTVIKNPMRTLEVNIQGVFNILKATSQLRSIKRFVDFSTSEVFGQHAYNVDEFVINPKVTIGEGRWTYAISKLAGEFITHAYHLEKSMPTVTIRPFNIYGPNQVGVGAIHHFVVRAINGEDLIIHDDGSQIRAWCYVDDFVEGVLLAMLSPTANGKSYNIGNPRSTITIYNLAHLIRSLANSKSDIRFRRMNHQDVALRIPNITAARSDLGFEPKVEIEDGLRRTIDWYRKRNTGDEEKGGRNEIPSRV